MNFAVKDTTPDLFILPLYMTSVFKVFNLISGGPHIVKIDNNLINHFSFSSPNKILYLYMIQ